MIPRRSFLKSVVVAAAVAPVVRGAKAKQVLIGSQLYGWGQFYQREGKAFNTGEILSALRDAGYDYAESSTDPDNLVKSAVQFSEQLRAQGLKAISMYTGGRLHDDKGEAVAAKLAGAGAEFRKAGFTILVCNPDPIGRVKTDAELETQLKNLKLIGSELNKVGVKLAIHHHTPEMANNAKEFHYNFQKSQPSEVGFCYDVHWVYRGGVKPVEALRDYSDRIHTWHLRQSREGIWWEDLDSGDIDYAAIAKHAREKNIPRNYTVELALENGTKITRTAVENHRRSIEFVRKVMA